MNFIDANYKVYLERMTNSFDVTSKGNIPKFVRGKTLDVGCGSGVLLEILPNAIGIDLNPKAVNSCIARGLNAKCVALEDINEKFDTIVFSSVLHEFSSYDDKNPFSVIPIMKALCDANSKLNPGGQIIIRDGVEASEGKSTLIVRDKSTIDAVEKYKNDSPVFKDTPIKIITFGNMVTAPSKFLKEFMFTYTWGPDSYPREVNEKYGILTIEEWDDCVKSAGFEIQFMQTQAEEYVKYLSKHFYISDDLEEIFKDATIFIVATKN